MVPLFFDEYRPGAWNNYDSKVIHEELRNVYNRNAAERGRANLTTKTYPLTAPIILCGEDRPRDTTGLEERMIVLNPNKDVVDGISEYGTTCQENFGALQNYQLESFALPYWSWALKQKDWSDVLEAARGEVTKLKESENLNMPERIVNNLSILKFGWSMYFEYAHSLGILPNVSYEFDEIMKQAYFNVMPSGRHENEFDQLVSFIVTMVSNGELDYRRHYSIKNHTTLILRLKDILPVAKAYANKTQRNKELLGEDAYYSIIRRLSDKEFSYVLSSSEKGTFYSSSGGDTTELRGVALDIKMLEETLDIEAGIWN